MRDQPDAPLLLFVHMRKTAGTTISWVMGRQFRRDEVMRIDAPTTAVAAHHWNSIEPEHRARIRCVYGHLPYGSELFAPRRTKVFTLLREPVARVVSEYYFNLHTPGTRFHKVIVRERMTLDRFVNSPVSAEVHNTQTRLLSGATTAVAEDDLLPRAMSNIRDRMTLVGITERVDETLLLCRAILGWRYPIYRNVNVNRSRPSLGAVTPATLATIAEANSLDRELYKFACGHFEHLLSENQVSTRQIATFRRISRLYGSVRRVIGFPREVWIEMKMAARRRVVRLSEERDSSPRSDSAVR